MATAMPRRTDVEQAREDICRRTLAGVARSLDRLVYLASLRDYNTGLYYHDGLASRFGQDVACEALAECHHEAFRQLARCSLKELVQQMGEYMASTHTNPHEFVASWTKLEPYRVAVPVETDQLSVELLFSNFKVALAILGSRLDHRPPARVA